MMIFSDHENCRIVTSKYCNGFCLKSQEKTLAGALFCVTNRTCLFDGKAEKQKT